MYFHSYYHLLAPATTCYLPKIRNFRVGKHNILSRPMFPKPFLCLAHGWHCLGTCSFWSWWNLRPGCFESSLKARSFEDSFASAVRDGSQGHPLHIRSNFSHIQHSCSSLLFIVEFMMSMEGACGKWYAHCTLARSKFDSKIYFSMSWQSWTSTKPVVNLGPSLSRYVSIHL